MKLNEVIPWGRNLEEYKLMFNLSEIDLNAKILGCSDGPASFNAEMTQLGYSVTSFDPIYQFSAQQIKERIEAVYDTVISQAKQNAHRYVWKNFRDADELGYFRLATMEKFLADYETGKIEGRYLPQSLPNLNLPAHQFELGLCSHFLFLYSEQRSIDFHLASIKELLRICSEVRIFPLLQLDCQLSPYVDLVIEEFECQGFQVQIQPVAYEFQKNGNKMLRIKSRSVD